MQKVAANGSATISSSPSNMVNPDYTVNLTTYGDYNVWISERNDSGFWLETNAENDWSFDWSVIGCRKDAKLEVEPDAC